MKPTKNTWLAGPAVLDRLGIAEDPLVGADPVSFLRSLAAAGAALAKNPMGTAAANARLIRPRGSVACRKWARDRTAH